MIEKDRQNKIRLNKHSSVLFRESGVKSADSALKRKTHYSIKEVKKLTITCSNCRTISTAVGPLHLAQYVHHSVDIPDFRIDPSMVSSF